MRIPKDGYYIARVQLDTGGEHQRYVRVKGGKLHDEEGEELLPQACGDFNELSSVMIAWVWPEDVAMELEALRTANAGLVERVKQFTEALSDPAAVWANMLRGSIAMPTHIPELEGRLTDAHALADRFQKAGQDAIDYIDGKHRDAGRVLDGWRKANQ